MAKQLPPKRELQWSILKILKQKGKDSDVPIAEIYASVAEQYRLPNEVRDSEKFGTNVRWTLYELNEVGVIKRNDKVDGIYAITDSGYKVKSQEKLNDVFSKYSKSSGKKNFELTGTPVYAAATDWCNRCLVEDGSIFFEKENLWTPVLLGEIVRRVVENEDDSNSTFIKKLEGQISGGSSQCCQLMAEVLWLIFLFQVRSNITADSKRNRITEVWSWSKEELNPEHLMLSNSVLGGMGSAGVAYNRRRFEEISYLLFMVLEFKKLNKQRRNELVINSLEFDKWLDKFSDKNSQLGNRHLRHILLHLIFPDVFEPISKGDHKRKILIKYTNFSDAQLKKMSWVKINQELFQLRQKLESERRVGFSFYDFEEEWNPQSTGSVSNNPLNLIFYGPPGTGKTYRVSENSIEEEDNLLKKYIDDDGNRYFVFVTFHQNYSYEDFVEGIRPDITKNPNEYKRKYSNKEVKKGDITYSIQHGVLRRICEDARKFPSERFALIIDEINRGNIAKIFGELITLIEVDKRIEYDKNSGKRIKGCTGLEVTLPYSGDQFGVPKNVDFIGTMNTADRSITLIDSALRRRFEFREIKPAPEILGSIPDGKGGKINLEKLLKTMNARITHLLHQDQTIGHSYFLKIETFEHLQKVFAHKIMPLLREYFYNDWHQIQLVFADQAVGRKYQLVKTAKVTDLFPKADDGITNNDTFYTVDESKITPDSIRKIYDSNLRKKLENSENTESSE